jgi:hypothetical protein
MRLARIRRRVAPRNSGNPNGMELMRAIADRVT